jgi:hypothetical protein
MKPLVIALMTALVLSSGWAESHAASVLEQIPGPLVDTLPTALTFYVGTTDNHQISLGIVRDRSGNGAAFLCDGAGIWEWFTGKASARKFVGTGAHGSVRARLRKNGTASVVRGDTTLSFALQLPHEGAGLFRDVQTVDGDDAVAGWIVTNDGVIRGTVQIPRGGTTASVDVDVATVLKKALVGVGGTTLTSLQINAAVDAVVAGVPEFSTSDATVLSFGLSTRCAILKRGFIAAGEVYVESPNATIENVALGVKGVLAGRYRGLGCSSIQS